MRKVASFLAVMMAITLADLVSAQDRTQRDHASGLGMPRVILDRFPGAILLEEAEFASSVVGRMFRYREVGSNLVVERPKEVFVEGGQYRVHWLRTISYGTYSIERGIVSIDCADCQRAFLGLGRQRIFFRRQGGLFTANADGDGRVIELIREP